MLIGEGVAETPMARLLLIDARPIFHEALSGIRGIHFPDFEVIGVASGQVALRQIEDHLIRSRAFRPL